MKLFIINILIVMSILPPTNIILIPCYRKPCLYPPYPFCLSSIHVWHHRLQVDQHIKAPVFRSPSPHAEYNGQGCYAEPNSKCFAFGSAFCSWQAAFANSTSKITILWNLLSRSFLACKQITVLARKTGKVSFS